jgi:hypothetical protein
MASAAKPVPAGDVVALIAAINAAKTHGEDNPMLLEAGTYLLTAAERKAELTAWLRPFTISTPS